MSDWTDLVEGKFGVNPITAVEAFAQKAGVKEANALLTVLQSVVDHTQEVPPVEPVPKEVRAVNEIGQEALALHVDRAP